MINTAETIAELDFVLHKFRKLLRPANIGAATIKLEHLRRYEQFRPHAHKVLRVAAELHKYVDIFSDRLSLTQVANVVRGMSSAQYPLPRELLLRLAAGLLAEDGGALRFAANSDVRDIFYGFAGQGFTNPLFWSRLCSAVLPRLPSLDPNHLPGLLMALEQANQLPPTRTHTHHHHHQRQGETAPALASADGQSSNDCGGGAGPLAPTAVTPQMALAREALRLMAGSLERLQPGRLADAAGLLVTVAPQLDAVLVDKQLAGRVQAAAMPFLPSFTPSQLTGLLLGLLYMCREPPPPHTPPAFPADSASPHPTPLPANFLTAAEPHLRAAAPAMQLLHVKRAVQALAPSAAAAAAAAAAAQTPGPSADRLAPHPDLSPLLNLLARRAAQLLPTAAELAAGAPRPLSRGQLAHMPRGGKGAGAVLAAAAPAGDPRVALDTPLLGLMEGLVRAYSRALGPAGAGAGGAAEGDARAARRRQLADVAVLFERVAVVAAAGQARGLLAEEQRLSLGVRLPLLLEGEGLLAPRGLSPAAGPGAAAAAGAAKVEHGSG